VFYIGRICPGRHLAEPSLFLSIAMTLSTFNISRAHDELTGELIEPAFEWLPGTIRYVSHCHTAGSPVPSILDSHPKPFRCDIKPRFPAIVDLIKHAIGEDKVY
jgi:hypothetical protein